MAIINMDGLVAAIAATTAQNISWNKTSAISRVGTFFDLAFLAGTPANIPTPSAASAGGTTYTRSSNAGLAFNAPVGGSSTYVLGYNASSTVGGTIYIIDRLWACSGLSIVSGATTTVTGMTPVSRYSGGIGAEIWYTCFSGSATGSGEMTVSYTNSDGVSGRSATISITGSAFSPPYAGMCQIASLQAGDKGVRSIQSVTNTTISFSAGSSHGLFLARRLVTAPMVSITTGSTLDGLRTGLQQLDSDACINFIHLSASTITGYWVGNLLIVEG